MIGWFCLPTGNSLFKNYHKEYLAPNSMLLEILFIYFVEGQGGIAQVSQARGVCLSFQLQLEFGRVFLREETWRKPLKQEIINKQLYSYMIASPGIKLTTTAATCKMQCIGVCVQ